MGKRLFILGFCFFALSLKGWANPALAGHLQRAVERGIRQTLKLSGCTEWLVEEASPKISQRVSSLMEAARGRMSEMQMAQELDRVLAPKNLVSLIQYTDDIPQKELVVHVLKSSKSSFAVARAIISRQFLTEISSEATSQQGLFGSVWEKAKAVVTRGTKVDREEVLDILLAKSQDPKAWTEELVAKASQGLPLLPEELVAYHSFFSPVEDLVLAEAIEQLYFRQALAIEFWIRRPKEVQYFFDRIRGVILPAQSRDLFPVMDANFSTAVLNAIQPDRRAAGFWHGLPASYARDKVTSDVRSQMLRLMRIKSLEAGRNLDYISYQKFLIDQIRRLEGEWKIRRLLDWEIGKLSELKQQLALLERYQSAFQGTAFDIFSQDPLAKTLSLEEILEPQALKVFRRSQKFQYWWKNAGLILVTTLFCIIDQTLEERPEEMIQPEEIYLPDSAVVKDIDLKINLITVDFQTETNPERIARLQAYLSALQEERKKYVRKSP